jgi:hypothetical protein
MPATLLITVARRYILAFLGFLSLLAQENSIQIYDLGGDELSSLFG